MCLCLCLLVCNCIRGRLFFNLRDFSIWIYYCEKRTLTQKNAMFAVLTKRFSKPEARNGCEEYTRGETEEWLKTGKPCMNNEVGLSVNPS